MANSNTYTEGIGTNDGQVTTLSQVQGAGLSLPVNSKQFIDTRAPGKLEILFTTNNNDSVIYSKNKPQDLYLKGLVQSQLAPPFYVNPNEGQKNKISANRSFPVQAAVRDTTRIRRFLGSSKGGSFLTKQILLQGFAPFDETKIYNPASPLLASLRLASFGTLERPTRFIDSSNILGGLIGAAGLGGITKAIGGLFGATEGDPAPPRSTVASGDSSPKGGFGGFFNIGGIFGGNDKSDKVMPITSRDGVKGLIRGNTATNAYNNKRYSSLVPPTGGGGFFSNLLSAAGSFLKNNTLLGGILPPQQPIAGLNYRADEETYKYMLISDRWSNFTLQGGDKSKHFDPGIDQGNGLLYQGTQSTTKGGFIGALIKGLGFSNRRTTNNGTSAIRFYSGGDSNRRVRLYINKNIDNRKNSKLTTTYDVTDQIGKLSLSDTTKITQESINDVNSGNIQNGYNRYGDVIKVDQDIEYSDQLLNYSLYSNEKLSVQYQRTYSDKENQLVKELNNLFESSQNNIAGANGSKYGYNLALGKPQQYVTDDIGFNYINKTKSTLNNKTSADDPNDYSYQGRFRKNSDIINYPSRLGKLKNKDRFINPTNDVDYVNSLGVLNDVDFASQYDEKHNGLGPDYVKFYFYDVVNNKFIPFKATIRGLQDNNTATWEPIEYLGRPDKLYYYKGFTREVNFSFKVVAGSVKELLPMWQRINYLTGLTRPSNYTSGKNGGFMVPPMVQLTLGDFYKNHCIVINSCNITIPDDASWELLNESYIKQNDWNYNVGRLFKDLKGKVAQFPKEAEINMAFAVMEKERTEVGKSLWGNSVVPVEVKTGANNEFILTDNYQNKDYSNDNNNDFSTNMRYDNNSENQKSLKPA